MEWNVLHFAMEDLELTEVIDMPTLQFPPLDNNETNKQILEASVIIIDRKYYEEKLGHYRDYSQTWMLLTQLYIIINLSSAIAI